MKSIFETLVDMDDYYEDEPDVIAGAFADDYADYDEGSGGMFYGETEEYTPTQREPEYEKTPEVEKIEEIIKSAEPPSQDLLDRAGRAGTEGGELGIKKFFDELSGKEKNSMLRYAMGAMGMGASQAIRAIQQRREQEFRAEQSQRGYAASSEEAERERQFRREMADRQYFEARAKEERALEERRARGTPQAYQFNVTPRGIIGGGMGG